MSNNILFGCTLFFLLSSLTLFSQESSKLKLTVGLEFGKPRRVLAGKSDDNRPSMFQYPFNKELDIKDSYWNSTSVSARATAAIPLGKGFISYSFLLSQNNIETQFTKTSNIGSTSRYIIREVDQDLKDLFHGHRIEIQFPILHVSSNNTLFLGIRYTRFQLLNRDISQTTIRKEYDRDGGSTPVLISSSESSDQQFTALSDNIDKFGFSLKYSLNLLKTPISVELNYDYWGEKYYRFYLPSEGDYVFSDEISLGLVYQL